MRLRSFYCIADPLTLTAGGSQPASHRGGSRAEPHFRLLQSPLSVFCEQQRWLVFRRRKGPHCASKQTLAVAANKRVERRLSCPPFTCVTKQKKLCLLELLLFKVHDGSSSESTREMFHKIWVLNVRVPLRSLRSEGGGAPWGTCLLRLFCVFFNKGSGNM